VRLCLEQLTPQAFSLETVQRALPSCLIHTVAGETTSKQDLSYFVVEAWVDNLEDIPTEVTIDIHEPRPCVDPLAHIELAPGFTCTDEPVPGAGAPATRCHHQEFSTNPPRLLSTTTLVHLDSSISIRPAPSPRNQWTSRDDDRFEDGDDETTLHEEVIHSWTHGLADDAWHQRIESASSGSAAGQHRTGRRAGGGHRRALTPPGFTTVPIFADHAGPDAAPLGQGCPNGVTSNAIVPASPPPALCPAAVNTVISETALPLDKAAHQDGAPTSAPPCHTVDPTALQQPMLSPSSVWATASSTGPDNGQRAPPQHSIFGSVLEVAQACSSTAMLQLHTKPGPQAAMPDTAPHMLTLDTVQSAEEMPVSPVAVPAVDANDADGEGTQKSLVNTPPRLEQVDNSGPAPSPAQPTSPAQQTAEELLESIRQPITPGLLPLGRSTTTPPVRPRRTRAQSTATATRRSHRVKERKLEVTGGGNATMKLARKLIVSKRGLAIAENGEESEDEILERYKRAFDAPLSPAQMGALTSLAKGASRRRRTAKAAPTAQLVSPVK
jgi:hypothetical protein